MLVFSVTGHGFSVKVRGYIFIPIPGLRRLKLKLSDHLKGQAGEKQERWKRVKGLGGGKRLEKWLVAATGCVIAGWDGRLRRQGVLLQGGMAGCGGKCVIAGWDGWLRRQVCYCRMGWLVAAASVLLQDRMAGCGDRVCYCRVGWPVAAASVLTAGKQLYPGLGLNRAFRIC